MKKNLYAFISIPLFGILVFDIYFLFFTKDLNCNAKIFQQKKYDINIFQKHILSSIYENELLDINDCEIYNGKETVRLNDMLTKGYVLVLRFSEFNCSACIDFTINQLKLNFKDFKTNPKIVLIYDSERMRLPLNIFEKPTFLTPRKNLLGLPMENRNTPFIFILDKDMKAKYFFVPEKSMPELTNEYFSIIKKRFL